MADFFFVAMLGILNSTQMKVSPWAMRFEPLQRSCRLECQALLWPPQRLILRKYKPSGQRCR
ncbi:MAG: hypothetical protein A2Y50_15055 [Pseudomonadales bacterium RIFCSPLOWO2_12_59_9]|nr:MAG: hypothetical protein A2Y50_15055 [Pseudomonadales bacterium RIFCSPLOWO2_12_59_9]